MEEIIRFLGHLVFHSIMIKCYRRNKPIHLAPETRSIKLDVSTKTRIFLEVKFGSPKKNRTRINMISVIRSDMLYLQIVLIKQPGPVPQYRMQVSNIMSCKISYFSYFAPQKQISCNRNEPKQCIST